MEPSHKSFVSHHRFYNNQGHEVTVEFPSEEEDPFFTQKREKSRPEILSESSVNTVYKAQGIHHHVTVDLLNNLPDRFEKGSVKAKLTWYGALCLNGVGMFVEAFVIITTGQVKTIWHDSYPTCWVPNSAQHCPESIECCGLFINTPADVCMTPSPEVCASDGRFPSNLVCPQDVTGSVSYAEFTGIMAGMIVFGYIADLLGRKAAGNLTSVAMITGISFMTFFDSKDLRIIFSVFSISFALFGLGVGGEYPLTASGAAECHVGGTEPYAKYIDEGGRSRHRMLVDAAQTARRGETIALVFTMQGVGAVIGSMFLLCLIYFSDQTHITCDDKGSNSSGNNPHALWSVWRSFYFIGLIFVILLLIYRSLVVEESEDHLKVQARKIRRNKKLQRMGVDKPSLRKILYFYAPRLIGTGGSWFVWDFAFYGLKLFSGPIFDSINPGGDLVVKNGWLLVNNISALAGYYCAAAVIDNPKIGRKKLQMISFFVTSVLFWITAGVFDNAPTEVVMTLYFATSFFGQFGANVTTYVMAAETYPTELRATCHGLSAFLGKIGALIATLTFSHLPTKGIFWVCGATGLAGFFFTYVFSVDLTLVSLAEHDAQLELFLEGRPERYKGELNDPLHLSNFEIWTGRHGEYDPNWADDFVNDELLRAENSDSETPTRVATREIDKQEATFIGGDYESGELLRAGNNVAEVPTSDAARDIDEQVPAFIGRDHQSENAQSFNPNALSDPAIKCSSLKSPHNNSTPSMVNVPSVHFSTDSEASVDML